VADGLEHTPLLEVRRDVCEELFWVGVILRRNTIDFPAGPQLVEQRLGFDLRKIPGQTIEFSGWGRRVGLDILVYEAVETVSKRAVPTDRPVLLDPVRCPQLFDCQNWTGLSVFDLDSCRF